MRSASAAASRSYSIVFGSYGERERESEREEREGEAIEVNKKECVRENEGDAGKRRNEEFHRAPVVVGRRSMQRHMERKRRRKSVGLDTYIATNQSTHAKSNRKIVYKCKWGDCFLGHSG